MAASCQHTIFFKAQVQDNAMKLQHIQVSTLLNFDWLTYDAVYAVDVIRLFFMSHQVQSKFC